MKVRIPNQNGGMSQQQMLKKVQQMQEDMATLQADLDEREYTAEAGGGMVSVTVTGKHEIKAVNIKPEALEECEGDPEMLEDFLIIALNEAISNAAKTSEEEMGKITSGLNIPGMPGMF
ncbi:MAG: YbaB/EbfC family nucleoid-associated protein [Clostridia bacterium]|nr:YbaB/EbfC family nucleoid-associated protein [Clostridia bacterium]